METENWKDIKSILFNVLNLDTSERRNYLEQAHIAPETREEVESLLSLEDHARDFMSVSASGFAKELFNKDNGGENSFIKQQIGIYGIVREIGCGGMGTVYLARRTDGKFEQKVAIKILKREFNTERIRRCFEKEKTIQAALSHPNIAALLDAGTTADGIPYLVMEYIEGEPIDKFCESRDLSLKERLKIFNKACDAVAFAHSKLIVHRDLKPSNILVSATGELKLLDFGISKLLDTASEENDYTLTNLAAMTPQYASPEQIRSESVTTATDIYSLGVILFKILTGNFPYNFKNTTNDNLLREITDSEPILASKAANPQSAISDRQSKYPPPRTGSSNFASQLKGDLDNIILKSLRKNPERRYQTVEQFSADIWRFVDGKPVLARSATFSYRASKFFKRNKIAVIAGILIFLSLITGTVVAISQARAANDARKSAEIETQRARAEEDRAEKISKFITKIISYANPAWFAEGAKFGGNARVIDALDDLSDKMDTEFAGQADIQSELHHKFNEVYNFVAKSESDPARAESYRQKRKFHALRALELRKQFYGERHELVAKDLYYAHGYLAEDERERAALLMKAINMMRETNPKNLNLPYMLEAYAKGLSMDEFSRRNVPYLQAVLPATNLGRYEIAELYYEEMLELFRPHYEDGHYAILLTNCYAAIVELKQNKFAEADEHYKVCKQAENKFQLESQSKPIKNYLEQIEELRREK